MQTQLLFSPSSVDPQANMTPIIQEGQKSHKKKKHLRWSVEEDERLLNGIKEFGTKWETIVHNYFTSPDGSHKRDSDTCASHWKHYWKKRYKVSQIQAIKEKIRLEEVEEKRRKDRRIVNLINRVIQSDNSPFQIDGAAVSDSQYAISTSGGLFSRRHRFGEPCYIAFFRSAYGSRSRV